MNNFSSFSSVKQTATSIVKYTAESLIDAIRSDAYKPEVDAIRSAPDKDTRSALKARLPAVTASGVFSKAFSGCAS